MERPIHRQIAPPLALALVCSIAALLQIGSAGPAERPTPLPDPPAPLEPMAAAVRSLPDGSVWLRTAEGDRLRFRPVIVTGYTSSPRETDSTPFLTASMTRVRPGCLALSRDLLRAFTPGAPFDFGDCVVVAGVGLFVVEDTMNARWRNRADIWFKDRRQALRWGRRRVLIARLPRPLDESTGSFALGPSLAELR